MSDEFNENDLADLSGDSEAPAEQPNLSPQAEKNIESALDRFFGKAADSDLEEAGVDPKEVEKEAVANRAARNRRAAKEQHNELVEEGLEPEDGQDEDTILTDEKENTEEETDKEEKPVVADAAAPSPLSPQLRYTAQTILGWDDKKIDRLVKADPELAAETITELAESQANLSRQLLHPASQVAPGTQPVVQTPAQPEAPLSNLDKFHANLSEFAEANGEELTEYVKALKAEVIDPVRAMFAQIEVQKQELSKTEARQTFTTLSDNFSDLYGKAGEALTPLQQKAKADLGEVADMIRAGSKLKGHEISVKDALNRAHLLVSHEYQQQAMRKSIKEQVQTRSKTLQAKPTNRVNPGVVTSGKSRASAEDALAKKAAELGIEGFDE